MNDLLLRRRALMMAQKNSRLPSEYQEVEYLESTGTQYIDAGFTWSRGDSLEFGFHPLVFTATQRYFGGLNLSSGIGFGLRNDGQFMYAVHNNWHYDLPAISDIDYTISVSSDGYFVINRQIVRSYGVAYSSTMRFMLFAVNYNGTIYYPASIKLRYFKHTNRDMVPCYRKSDHKPGMYDLVTKTFFTNQGAGEFIVGADVN